MINKLIYTFPEQSMRINSWGYIDSRQIGQNDFYEESINKNVIEQIKLFFMGNSQINIVEEMDYAKMIKLKKAIDNEGGQFAFLFCKVISNTDINGLVRFYCDAFAKLWVNESLVAVVTKKHDTGSLIPFKKGENIIVIELSEFRKETTIGLYLNNIKANYQNNPYSYLNCIETLYGQMNVLYKVNDDVLECTAIPNDSINIDLKQRIELSMYDINSGRIVNRTYCIFRKKNKINIFEMCDEYPLKDGCFVIAFHYKTLSHESKIFYIDTLFYKNKENLDILRNRAISCLASNVGLTEYDKCGLEYYLNSDKLFRPDFEHKFMEMIEFSDMLKYISSGKHLDDILYETGVFRKFYKSSLDEQIVSYMVSIPEKFDIDKEWPLVIIISIAKYNDPPTYLCGYTNKGVIAINISGRGVMLGSYIAEAAIWETISDIKKTYNIDSNRIYLIGFSNGGSAAWTQAQCYPHLIAGIIPIAGSVYKHGIKNLSNIRVINISSKLDFLFETQYIDQETQLSCYTRYKSILCENMTHPDLGDIPYESSILDELLKYKLDPYPNEIYFWTERNRHLKSFWITLDAIPPGKKYSLVEAKIVDQTIYIKLENSNGITLTLPPQIDKSLFTIIINACDVFKIENYKRKEISFRKSNKHFQISVQNKLIDYRKGTGLLDVYLGPIEIVVADESKQELRDLAKKMSRPTTNGMDDVVIAVDYPIFNADNLSDWQNGKNLIIIDNNSDHSNIQIIREHCLIKTYSNYFTYKEKRFSGSYLIMQIIPSLYNEKLSILYINCNDLSLIKKNIFTRRVIIPSYINGIHTFLNNMALVFHDNKYYSLYEWGEELTEIQ